MKEQVKAAKASMGPPSGDGGEGHVGGVNYTDSGLQWGRRPETAESAVLRMCRDELTELQWGRRPETAERTSRI